jgi:dUTP pyrophosphatase
MPEINPVNALTTPTVNFRLLTPAAKLPTRAHPGDAGLDLYASNAHLIMPGCITVVETDLAVDIPFGYEGQVRGRSGLAFNNLIFCVHNGTIDHGYQGPIKVLMQNASTKPFTIEQGTRLAQLIISPVMLWTPKAVESFTASVRGTNGFGSTGA